MPHIQFIVNGDDFMKKSMLVMCLILVVFTGVACSVQSINNNDWSYDLPNKYAIWHVNSRKIVCGKKETEHSIRHVVEEYVLQFCYDEQYIFLECVEISEDSMEEIDSSNPIYYIINNINDEVNGPFSETEFGEKQKSLQTDKVSTWIKTKPKPEGAHIP